MASPPIPEPVAAGLQKINLFSDDEFEELVTVLESIPARINQRRVFDDPSVQLANVSEEDYHSLREALFSLYMGKARVGVPTSTYVSDLIQAFAARIGKDRDVSIEGKMRFEQRLTRLLNIRKLGITVKALDVISENERTFSKARILSDIRPIFGDSIELFPAAAVVVHMLKIDFLKNGDRHEFVIALDNLDIQGLIDALERAKSKTASLKTIISATEMEYVDVV